MSTAYGDSSYFYLTRRSQAHDCRQRMVQAKHGGTVLLRASTQGLYILHHHILHHRTTLHKSSLRAHRSQGARRSRSLSRRAHRPPSSVRSKSTSPSGPYSSSVDTPTVTQYPSAAQDGRHPLVLTSHPRNTHTQPPSQRQPPSTRTQLLSTSIPPPSPASPRAPGIDLDSYHIRAIYAALDVSGIRGTAMKMTGSCKAGERLQSCSAAAFCPRHISQDGPPALGISHAVSIFSNDPSLTVPSIGGTQARRL